MRWGTFACFDGRPVFLVLLFIAFPLATILIDSFQVTRRVFTMRKVETCTPGFPAQTSARERSRRCRCSTWTGAR